MALEESAGWVTKAPQLTGQCIVLACSLRQAPFLLTRAVRFACTVGKVWAAYDQPGGCPVGCLCGGMWCCHFLLRAAAAKDSGINDGTCAFIGPICCGPFSLYQIVQEAKDSGKLEGYQAV